MAEPTMVKIITLDGQDFQWIIEVIKKLAEDGVPESLDAIKWYCEGLLALGRGKFMND